MKGVRGLNLSKKTEIVDEKILKVMKELLEEYEGAIRLTSDSNYSDGKISIIIKD